jgi:hypothetical protein
MAKKNKKQFKDHALEALEKFPSGKVFCAIVVAILLAVILYIVTLFLLSR